jgi:allophanate hydrolase
VPDRGAAIAIEIWEMASRELGSFMATIPSPLALGKIELSNGEWVTGFVCESYGLESGTDITEFGGWRAWLAREGMASGA